MLLSQALIVFTLFASSAQPESAQDLSYNDDIIPMRRNRYGLYIVDVSLGRQFLFSGNPNADPLPFIVDTGANKTAVPRLIAGQLIDEEDLQFNHVGHGMTEQFLTDLFFVDQLNFGWGERQIEVAVIEETYGSVLSAAGILGRNAFTEDRIEIDFPQRRITHFSDETVRMDLRLAPLTQIIKGHATFRNVSEPVHIMIDTGAQVSLVNTALANLRRTPSQRASINIGSVSSDSEVQSEERRFFGGMRMGEMCLGPFWVSVLDAYAFEAQGWENEPAIILGMDVLEHSTLKIDYETGAVALDGITDHICPS